MNEPFATALASFVAHAQSKVDQNNAEMQSKFPAPRISAMEPGPKYIRLVKSEGGSVSPVSRSAFGFVDLATGNLLMAKSWKAPALNFARGNIFQPETWGCCSPWSVR